MKNPTAQINGTLTAIWVVPNERDYQLAFEETEEETAKMFKKDRSARKFFLDRMADLRMMGFKCLEEEDDYFEEDKK